MEKLLHTRQKPYYETENEQLYLGDSFRLLLKMEPESVDMIFADPPYFLSNDGVTCQGGKMVSVNKGEWDQGMDCGSKHAFNRRWLRLCKKVLKPDGTIWISGTLHNIYSIGMALEQEGYKIINNITQMNRGELILIYQQHHLAENQSAAESGLPLLHSFHGNHSLGAEGGSEIPSPFQL